ncbi:cytochrome c oxidase assembly factor CtaG [Bacillus sp. DNRA2]|uniref:cytochrome c oxidase assembly factor CtaG n=1 Tax=Bacillus sp. DNRA2 TaxID=2723053 RepID=UPI00145CBBD2|nr:cytochrome c oxidase assembly factor CtaG [Bacillus sp. DNRA2]NMD71958.1 cytochrome c oxidase assembly factor CtaG [Bacillus sp. DNRA2]
MPVLDVFGFRALWSPYFLIALIAILVGFFLITVTFQDKFSNSEKLTKKEGILFTTAMVLLYAIKGSPLDLMGHLMFYAHMIQMAMLYLVIAPIFIVGIPNWIWRKVLNNRMVKPLFQFFTRPLIALILFNGMFSFYHVPLIFDVIKTNMWMHAGYTSILFVVALFMWWPLVNKVEEYQTLSGLKKIGYIFADGILITPACALIIFADSPMYATFSDPNAWMQALQLCVPSTTLASLDLSGPEMFNSLSLIDDQQLGGVLMKIIQEVVYGVVLAQVFFSWYKKDKSENIDEEGDPALYPNLAEY